MNEKTLTTAVPGVTLTAAGLAIPDIADVLAGRLADFDAALGGGMSRELTTPQGQIASSEAEIIAEVYDRLLCLFNQINPDYAAGRFQDGIGRLYFLTRIAGRGTLVTATCSGAVGAVIPAGSLAQDTRGYQYVSVNAATLPASGSAEVLFQNTTQGPIPCGAGELIQIYRAVPGWSAITNHAAGVLGNEVEGRTAFEARRRRSVAANARNLDVSLQAALLAVPGVTDAYVWSNRKSEAVTMGSTRFSVAPHSVYIGVYGGAQADIAQAIFNNKAPGCEMNGDTHYTVQQSEGYSPPYPEYALQWQTAKPTTVSFRVTLQNQRTELPADTDSRIQQAIIKTFTGQDDINAAATIGALIPAGRFYAGVAAVDPVRLNIAVIELSLDAQHWSSGVTLGIDQVPVTSETAIQVVTA